MQDRGRLGRVEAFGKRVKPFDRCNDEFGERALATLIAEAVGSHSIARPEVLGCFPDGDEGTHEITADDERDRHRSGKAPGPDEEVDVGDLAGLHRTELSTGGNALDDARDALFARR